MKGVFGLLFLKQKSQLFVVALSIYLPFWKVQKSPVAIFAIVYPNTIILNQLVWMRKEEVGLYVAIRSYSLL